ncbi:MAG: DNA polymerase III subunit chi [Litoreibacter sp.]
MSEVFFYHMTRQPLEVTLPMLLGKAIGVGWKVAIQGTSDARLSWLDNKLWEGDGFLPHACAGGEFDVEQPVLLTQAAKYPNAPECVMCIDGADLDMDVLPKLSRAMILFDGNDPDAVSHARAQWKQVKDANVAAKYWSQETGKWEMKAEHTPT